MLACSNSSAGSNANGSNDIAGNFSSAAAVDGTASSLCDDESDRERFFVRVGAFLRDDTWISCLDKTSSAEASFWGIDSSNKDIVFSEAMSTDDGNDP